MLLRSAYRGIERKDPGPEQVGLGYRAVSAVGVTKDVLRVWIREGNRSDVPLTQPGNGPEGTAAWGMSVSRRKAHFELWVIGRAALSDQGSGHKGPSTIQIGHRSTPGYKPGQQTWSIRRCRPFSFRGSPRQRKGLRVGSRAPGHYYHGDYRPEPKEGTRNASATCLMRFHGGSFDRSEALPHPISLTRCGLPRNKPAFHHIELDYFPSGNAFPCGHLALLLTGLAISKDSLRRPRLSPGTDLPVGFTTAVLIVKGLVPEKISISEFRRTIYNPGLAKINEFSWFPPANRASSVMESPGRTTGKDYGRGQTNPGTPQVDTVGVADPIETKTKPEADPDAYLGGAASLRVACHPFSPFSLLRSPRYLFCFLTLTSFRFFTSFPLIQLYYQWKIASDLRSTRKQKKEGPPERGETPERCMKETLESYRRKERFSRQIEKEGPIEKNVEMRVAFSSAGASSK
ncbi:hypothetical protein L6452_18578 [Arctium lappa]|uniref:Uncharacterized protein n=1 Tax=Arctium lappa TaxID=4217 RepID=A0ACB9C6M0_ARCLA|nr:hypothetical protein L6452_18578 [Arctium lappa]